MPANPIFSKKYNITNEQMTTYIRTSYTNSILIQSRGVLQDPPCPKCEKNMGPWSGCVILEDEFGGVCGNCKWTDRTKNCFK
ncbi:hypothetical protein BT63DRAFT_429569 [Microthyrium microscopicum]|uniref:Uncharacterized protein n=1 Tax=Microthyrium microscopicum TaxID=703497 RepID=A0A6A6TY06_9PEZI|nr:hypothetical protein BT63DRAFT_429569 [Microthyrium microscopicum]